MLYQEFIAAFNKDEAVKQEEMRLRTEAFYKKQTQLKALLEHRTQLKENICKDYFNERHRIQSESNPDSTLKEKLLLAQGVLKSKLETE